MLKKLLLIISFMLAANIAFTGVDYSKPKKTVIPIIQKAPVIDGKLTDESWKEASRATNFLNLARLKKTVSEQTEVLIMRDKDNLYFGFICHSHNPLKIKTTKKKGEHDPHRLYKDDVVEIFIDTEYSKGDFYQWVINSNGAITDLVQHRLLETEKMVPSIQWNSKAIAAGSKSGKKWFVEVKIPLSDFKDRDLKALKENKKWGLQFGRENWTAPDGKREFSTWSRTYKFTEPEDFGMASFTGAPVIEKIMAWEQTQDDTLFLLAKPKRVTYPFSRVFDFGPANQKKSEYPKGVIHVSPETLFDNNDKYGFVTGNGIKGIQYSERKFYYGMQLSPLVIDYIRSPNENVFKFDLPKGEYRAVFVCGTDMFSNTAPVDMDININGAKGRIQNTIVARTYMPEKIDFSTDGKKPVRIKITPAKGTQWVLNYFLVYPVKDIPEANRAFYWLERDNFNYPFEEYIKKCKLWLNYPPQKEKYITEEEEKAGFAIVDLPAAKFTPKNYYPQEEDSRGPLRALTSPGFRTSLHLGFYALRLFKDIQVKIDNPPQQKYIKIQLMQMNYQINSIGRSSLKQFGFCPRILARPESVWLEKNTMQSYYLITDVAKDTPPGTYNGKLGVYNGKQKLAEREFKITVLPFSPENKRQLRSVYFNSPLYQYHESKWSKYTDSENKLIELETRNQLRDLRRHGIDKIHNHGFAPSYVKGKDGKWHFSPHKRDLTFFKLMKEEGISESTSFIAGYDVYSPGPFILNEELRKGGYKPITKVPDRYMCKDRLSPEFFNNVSLLVRENIDFRKKTGVPVPAFEIWDEPGHIGIKALLPFLNAIHKGTGRTAVTLMPGCFPYASGKINVKNYNGMAMGMAGSEITSPGQVLKFRNKENSIYTVYYNASIRSSNPRLARIGFGYWAWAWNLNGLDPHKYYKIKGDLMLQASFQPMIFDEKGDLKMTTPAWEMHAEGTYDNNLIQKLEDLTAQTKNKSVTVKQAELFLKDLKGKSVINFSHVFRGYSVMTGAPIINKYSWPACRYDYLRAKLAEYIMCIKALDKKYPAIMQEIKTIESDAKNREKLLKKRMKHGMPASRKGNLLYNGGFEKGEITKPVPGSKKYHLLLSGFNRVSPQADLQDKVVHSGKRALRFKHDKKINNDVVYAEKIRLVPGKTYKFTGWAKRDAKRDGISKFTGFQILTYSNDPKANYNRRENLWFSQVTPSFDWEKYEYTFTAGPQEASLLVTIYYTDDKSVIYIDDLKVEEIDESL